MLSEEGLKTRVEITVRDDDSPLDARCIGYAEILDQGGLIELLQQKLGKSEAEVTDLLKSYERRA